MYFTHTTGTEEEEDCSRFFFAHDTQTLLSLRRRRICRPSSRRQRGSAESSVVLGRTNAQQRSRRNERDHLKFMRAKWYSRLHPASSLLLQVQGRGGGGNKTGDGIAFLFRGRRGGGSLSLRVTELPPSFPRTFPLGKWGVITKTLGRLFLSQMFIEPFPNPMETKQLLFLGLLANTRTRRRTACP